MDVYTDASQDWYLCKAQLLCILHIAAVHLHKGFTSRAQQKTPQPAHVLLLGTLIGAVQHSPCHCCECQQGTRPQLPYTGSAAYWLHDAAKILIAHSLRVVL